MLLAGRVMSFDQDMCAAPNIEIIHWEITSGWTETILFCDDVHWNGYKN